MCNLQFVNGVCYSRRNRVNYCNRVYAYRGERLAPCFEIRLPRKKRRFFLEFFTKSDARIYFSPFSTQHPFNKKYTAGIILDSGILSESLTDSLVSYLQKFDRNWKVFLLLLTLCTTLTFKRYLSTQLRLRKKLHTSLLKCFVQKPLRSKTKQLRSLVQIFVRRLN